MPEAAPLKATQIDVLAWIAAGTPQRTWANFTYKTTALALQARRLAVVSKKGGTWSATITDAGEYYLREGAYPEGHWPKRRPGARPKTIKPARPSPAPRPVTPAPGLALGPAQPTTVDLAFGLIDRVQRAGVLRIDTKNDRTDFRALVIAAEQAANLPQGKRLRIQNTGTWWSGQIDIDLEDDHWAQVPSSPVPVPARVTKYHTVARAYLDDGDWHRVSRASLSRAARIVHAIAQEAERRGYTVNHRTIGPREPTAAGQIEIKIREFTYPLQIHEIAGRGANRLPYSSYGSRTQPSWRQNRQYEFIPTGRLEIDITGFSKHGRTHQLRDTVRTPLENRLPELLRELEARAREDTQERIEREKQKQARRIQWERIRAQAIEKYIEAHKTTIVDQQVAAWNHANDLQSYLTQMRQTISTMPGGSTEQTAATEWLTWVDRHRKSIDPLLRQLRMPDIPAPSDADLRPYMQGLNPSAPPD